MGIPFYLHEDVFIPLFVGKLINLTMKIHVTPMNSLLQYPIMSGILSNGSFCSMTYSKGKMYLIHSESLRMSPQTVS